MCVIFWSNLGVYRFDDEVSFMYMRVVGIYIASGSKFVGAKSRQAIWKLPIEKRERKKRKEKKKNEMDMTLGETGGWQCWTEGGCGVVDGATNRRQFLGNGRLRYVGRSPLKKEDTWGLRLRLSTSCSRFSKTFPVISQNNQKWLFVSNESCSKVARKKQKLVLVWC